MKRNLFQTVGMALLLAGCSAPTDQSSGGAKNVGDLDEDQAHDVSSPSSSVDRQAGGGVKDGRVSGEFRESSFRPGLKVYFVYNEVMEEPYSSSWWVAFDKKNGDWVDIYYETNEKLTDNGIVSFKCSGTGDVGILSYFNEWANADNKTLYVIKPSMFTAWKNGSLPSENSPQLSYEAFNKIKQKFC